MKIIDADKIKEKYPDRKSLNQVLNNAMPISIAEQVEYVKHKMCDEYCKIPYKYSAGEWDEIAFNDNSPCNECPLNML